MSRQLPASELPERLSDLYDHHNLTQPQSRFAVDFASIHHSPSESNLYRYQNPRDPFDLQDELETVHWRRNQPQRSRTQVFPGDTEHGFEETMPSHPDLQYSTSAGGNTPEGKDSAKRWSFGGLFKRKEKPKTGTTVPVPIKFDSEQRPGLRLPSPDSESSGESEPRNFLRRLSKKKKASGDGSKAVQGFLKVPRHPAQHRGTPEVQSWETTKCPPPNLLTGSAQYSSSGSLSLSIEGSSSLSRESKMAAKEAVKARAEARRESILIDSSSSSEEWDDKEQSPGSLRLRRQQRISPAGKPVQMSPQRVSNSSPNLYGLQPAPHVGPAPKWEARVVYTQQTLPEDEPVLVRLPKRFSPRDRDSNGNPRYFTETVSDDKVITAGLHLPLQVSSSLPQRSEPIYANWRHQVIPSLSDVYRPASYFLDEYERNYQDVPDFRPTNHSHRAFNKLPSNYPPYDKSTPQPFVTYEQQPVLRKRLQSPMSLKPQAYVPETCENQSKNNFLIGQESSSGASPFWRKHDTWKNLEAANFPNQPDSVSRVGIRSADSSPLSVPKHAKIHSTPHIKHVRPTDSISSLSSFSAETPVSHSTRNVKKPVVQTQNRLRRIKSPEFIISTQPKETETKSACERLNVKGYTPSPPPPLTRAQTAKTPKSPGKNLEDALNELEDMYKNLRLSDEDLLDRAERRDLPTYHQELRDKEPVPISSPRYFRFASSLGTGSLESVATTSGSGSTDGSRPRVRAPPMRRSGVPDRLNDDMAKRKYDSRDTKVTDPREVMSQTGSYLAMSPAFSPPASPCPGDRPMSPYSRRRLEPDLVIDDVAVRNIRHANAIRIIDEPQPLFGVPLGPITKAPPSDYLHATPVEKYRPLFRHVKNPDIVKDDQAFRTLRKDLSQENSLSKNWTPRLFSPRKSNGSTDSVFIYNIQPEESGPKKLRAVRSLSANISHLVNPPCASSAIREDIGKWNSYTDLVREHHRASRSLTPSRPHFREASWVEQANLDGFGQPDTIYRPPSPNSNIKKKFKLVKPNTPPPKVIQHPEPRRPWTDIILQSYKEDENEPGMKPVGSPVSEEDNEVFVDASATTPSPPNPFAASNPSKISDFILLSGQLHRRGSYVDPPSHVNPTEEMKRRSWSETPKQFDSLSSAHAAIAKGFPRKLLFNPLPSPKRIKPMNLEGFSKHETLSRTEQTLDELLDALVKDADTCGTIPKESAITDQSGTETAQETATRKKRLSRGTSMFQQKEAKWQAAIAEIESASVPPTKNDPAEIVAKRIDKVPTAQDVSFESTSQQRYLKSRSEPPAESGQGSAGGYSRGILKRPTEGLSPILSGKQVKVKPHLKNSNATGLPPWHRHGQETRNDLNSDSSKVFGQSATTKTWKYFNTSTTPVAFVDVNVHSTTNTQNGYSVTQVPLKDDPSSSMSSGYIKGSESGSGMTGLRRLLNREKSNNTLEESAEATVVSRSAAGSTPFPYWSKIASSQPSFLRKFFEKVAPNSVSASNETKPQDEIGTNETPRVDEKTKSGREDNGSGCRPISCCQQQVTDGSLVLTAPPSPGVAFPCFSAPNRTSVSRKPFGQQQLPSLSTMGETNVRHASLTANGMSFSEPSKLSLKDRVNMFNQLTTCKSKVLINGFSMNGISKVHGPNIVSSPKGNCTRAVMTSGSNTNLNYFPLTPLQEVHSSSCDGLIGFPLFRNYSTNSFAGVARGSINQNVPPSAPIPVVASKKKSKCLSHSADNDWSEDGEVSSGGMEVAEIISKSFENSPMVQKKTWGSHHPQPQFHHSEVWRKFGRLDDNISRWSTATDLQHGNSGQGLESNFPKVIPAICNGRTSITRAYDVLPLLPLMNSTEIHQKPFKCLTKSNSLYTAC